MNGFQHLWKDDQPLINIATGVIAPIEMVDNIKNLQEMGTQDMEGLLPDSPIMTSEITALKNHIMTL